MTDIETDEMEQIAAQLESEVPYRTVAGVLDRTGWMDLLATVRAWCPEAYAAMRERARTEHAH